MRLIDLDEFLRQNCVDRMEGKTCEECKYHVLEVSCERLMEQPTAEVTLCHLDSPCEYQNADIAMPSAQQWIPVTERLPEKNGEYLVTEIDCITSERLTDIAYYDDFICTNNGFHKANDIAAWMPLPKPWKGDKDETD